MNPPDALVRAAEPVAPIPRAADGVPVFAEPWQAQAFALTLQLHERGLFTWGEWAEALGEEIRRGEGACADGSDYYLRWLGALERLVGQKGLAGDDALAARRAAWHRAAHATPHGAPVLLENDPERG